MSTLLDTLPLALKPYKVERNAWEADSSGGADYCGFEEEHQLGRFESLLEAMAEADRYLGNVKIYQMRIGKSGGEFGSPVYDNWTHRGRTFACVQCNGTGQIIPPSIEAMGMDTGERVPCWKCAGCGVLIDLSHKQPPG